MRAAIPIKTTVSANFREFMSFSPASIVIPECPESLDRSKAGIDAR
jgi:hypothetical protein